MRHFLIVIGILLFLIPVYGQEKYTVVLPIEYNQEQAYPLFIVFHGGFSNMDSIDKWWNSEGLKNEFIVVYMEASTLDSAPNRWGWRDLNQERNNVKTYYSEIIKNYKINEDQVYVGGFSLGARLSIDLTMKQTIPIQGFISLNHGGKISLSCTSKNILEATQRGVKGVLITGENDYKYKPQTYALNEMFTKHLLKYKFVVNKGIGHREPKDFSIVLDKYLNFIK